MTPPCVDCGRARKTKPVNGSRRCSACEKRRWRDRNPERNRQQRKAYRARNRAALTKKLLEWKRNNPEAAKRIDAEWRRRLPELVKEIARRSYLKNAPRRILGASIPPVVFGAKQAQLELVRFVREYRSNYRSK